MSSETLQLLKAFIDCMGCDVEKKPRVIGEAIPANYNPYRVTKKKPKPRKEAKAEGYSDGFLEFWRMYPTGHGGSKKTASIQYEARVLEGLRITGDNEPVHQNIVNGLVNYKKFIKATKRHVKMPETFLGKKKHYEDDFTIPDSAKQQSKIKLPYNNDDLQDFAANLNLRMAGTGEQFPAYRKYLEIEVEKLNES